MGDKQWHASSSGPDWMDIMGVVSAIESTYHVSVAIGLHAGGQFGTSAIWHITVLEYVTPLSVVGTPLTDLSGEWPCQDHPEVTHCLYAGLLRMDHLLTEKLTEQNKLPFTVA